MPSIIKRLFAKPVSREPEAAFQPVPKSEGEHARALPQRLVDAPGIDRGQQCFGIGMTAPLQRTAFLLQLPADIRMIVDFAIIDDHPAPTRRLHRLMPRSGQVDDGQPPMRHRDARFLIMPASPIVGAAMQQGGVHDGQAVLEKREMLTAPAADQATHAVCISLRPDTSNARILAAGFPFVQRQWRC